MGPMRGSVKSLIGLLVLASIVSAGSAFAAKNGVPGKPSKPSPAVTTGTNFSLVATRTDASGNPVFGSAVTFTVNTDATPKPWVENRCSQDGRLVYSDTRGFFDGYFRDGWFTLGPTASWDPSQSAGCVATLFSADGGKRTDLDSTTYTTVPA